MNLPLLLKILFIEAAIPKIVLERTGKPATPEFIEGATKTFGMWWLHTLEQIKVGK